MCVYVYIYVKQNNNNEKLKEERFNLEDLFYKLFYYKISLRFVIKPNYTFKTRNEQKLLLFSQYT